MKTKILVILICLFISFGTVYVYGYETDDPMAAYKQEVRDSQLTDIQYQLDEMQIELEQQRIRGQMDHLYDDCGGDYY